MMDSLGRKMKNYTAWFQNDKRSKTVLLKCDGISVPHAEARAWLKFFGHEEFKRDEGNWELETVEAFELK